jgi:hypothetical protein
MSLRRRRPPKPALPTHVCGSFNACVLCSAHSAALPRFIGRRICRVFVPHGISCGTVKAYLPANPDAPDEPEPALWHVEYDDGDEEDLDEEEVTSALRLAEQQDKLSWLARNKKRLLIGKFVEKAFAGEYYKGSVTEVNHGMFRVRYEDEDEEDLDEAELMQLIKETQARHGVD